MAKKPMCKLCKKAHWTYEAHGLVEVPDYVKDLANIGASNQAHLTASNGGDNASNRRGGNERDPAEVSNGVVVAGVDGEDSQRVEVGAASPGTPQTGIGEGLAGADGKWPEAGGLHRVPVGSVNRGKKQRWNRESYNAYMRDYMQRKRQAAYRGRK